MSDLIDRYARHLRDLGRAESSIATYLDVLHRLDRELPAGLVAAHAEELRDAIYRDGRGRATRKLYRAIVCGFFAWATDPAEPLLDFDPAALLPPVSLPQRKPRPVPDDQLADLLARAGDPFRGWFILAAFAGLRCCEIAALDLDHITEAHVWVQGKGSKERFVPTHPAVWQLTKRLPAGPVAADDGGFRLDRQQVSHRGNHHLHRVLGHDAVTMHRLRHSFGTRAYRVCRDIRAVQELLGHASIATTQLYVAADVAAMQRAVAGLVA